MRSFIIYLINKGIKLTLTFKTKWTGYFQKKEKPTKDDSEIRDNRKTTRTK